MLQPPCDPQILVPQCCAYRVNNSFWFCNAAGTLQFTISVSERCKDKTHSTDVSSKMLQTSCNLQRLASRRCKIFCTGKVPCNVQMLRNIIYNAMQFAGLSCKLQNAANTEQFCTNTMRLRNSNTGTAHKN